MHWVILHHVKIYSPVIYSRICDSMHIKINVLQARYLLIIVRSVVLFPLNWDLVTNTNVKEVLIYFKTYELLYNKKINFGKLKNMFRELSFVALSNATFLSNERKIICNLYFHNNDIFDKKGARFVKLIVRSMLRLNLT